MAKDKKEPTKYTTISVDKVTYERLCKVSLELSVKVGRRLSMANTIVELLDRLPREKAKAV